METAMEKARARALSLIGQGYIYGAKGQTCSPAFRQQQAKQYPAQAGYILNVGGTWDGKPVWDCAQLTRTVAKAAGLSLVSGATSQWEKTAWVRKGTVDTLPRGEMCWLYRRQNGSNTVMAHTGIALGDGTCVHARGTAYGVVRQEMGQYAWTHWASPWAAKEGEREEEETMEALYKAKVTALSGSTVNLRREPRGTVLQRVPIGTLVEVYEESAGWCKVGYGDSGKAEDLLLGYMQAVFLARETETNQQEEDAVTVSLLRSDALRLLEALNSATARG